MLSQKRSKKQIREESEQLNQQAQAHRRSQRLIAAERDDGLCVVCFFKHNKRIGANDIHHVYGRAITKRVVESDKENYRSLTCLCRKHHEDVGIIKDSGSQWVWLIDILNMANETPINKEFIHRD